jgi:leader peptidase (prepilin peptidase)/N-methyltransferase
MSAPFAELGVFGAVAAGLVGLVVGSFLNVLIHRLPRGESIVFPGSHCPSCGKSLGALDNVPLISWVLLRGRCRHCRATISPRYPAIELANGVLWVLAFLRAATIPELLSTIVLLSACLALLAIDAEFQLLPDAITLPCTAIGLALAAIPGGRSLLSAAVGAAVGAGSLWLVRFAYEKLQGVEGMGLGDVKMLGMVGAFLGPWGVLLTVLLGSVAGSLVGLSLLAIRRGGMKTRLPFGVFLALGAMVSVFLADPLWERYRALWPS